MRFTCSTCGREHDSEDISFGADRPLQWELLSEEERKKSELGDEQCAIDSREGRHFFVRACLEIPVRDTGKAFTWGVWVSLSERSFDEMAENWENPSREKMGPYFGWLCTRIPGYPDTMFLKTMVHNRDVGLRPRVVLEPTDHPLSRHQLNGIPEEELIALIGSLLHSNLPE